MANVNQEVTIVKPQPGVDPDLRALKIEMDDAKLGADPLEHLQEKLGNSLYSQFLWSSSFDGSSTHILSTARDALPEVEFNKILSVMQNDPAVTSVHLLHKHPDIVQELVAAKIEAAEYDSSWYWPVAERLPKSDYKAPKPIKIAQADSGVSLQPCLVGGFNPADSMSFFFPANKRKGKGVICWGQGAPFFISHGTSTGGLMVGQPTDGMNLHGMTLRDVVELVPCRIADSVVLNPPDLERLAECINWAVSEGIKVINVSLGAIAFQGDPALTALTRAVENAYKKGVIICAAAGQIAPGMIWPGVYSLKGWLVACGPSNASNAPSAQSIWVAFPNGYVTIGAPGENMPQAGWKGGICASDEPQLARGDGSSYSAAFTSSIAALWWARNYDALSKMNPRDIVPLFRHTIQNTCTPWNGNYYKAKFSPGILNPNKAINAMVPPKDLNINSSGMFHVERVPGGTYRNVTLHAHGSGSIHVLDPVLVEGKLTLISESSATISMSGTIICRELEIKIKSSALIEADDLEYYDKCTVNISHAGTLRAYIAAEGPMTGSVKGPDFWNGSTLRAWIFWRNGRKSVSISKDWMSTIDISNNWGGRWA
ncbi:S8 family serine peptidase [Gilvimarinus polysaccharolyticus]|uniref:S8 family serine peptidase n=1 Tax=Gilvimarinus polysaccharolyticus TaxID=863921 RepID=UPI0006738B85|nr:S8 family serine peptidase [Gilvimarinus polysaccharolyticus]